VTWSVPFTAVNGSILTAAQYNTFVRDNMSESEISKAQNVSGYFVTQNTNRIAERVAQENTAAIATSVTVDHQTDSTSYTDLQNSPGPEIDSFTGTSAIVFLYCNSLASAGIGAWMSFEVSGASTLEADNSRALQPQNTGGQHFGALFYITGLTEGINTFTAKYRVSTSGTASFTDRRMAVIPF